MISDNKREIFPTDILSALTEEQLKELLNAELMSEETDVGLIKRINTALETRFGQKSEYDVDAKWHEFIEYYAGTEPLYEVEKTFCEDQASIVTPPRRLRHPFLATAAAILVVVFMSGTFTAYALGYDVFEAMATWTKEIFSFTQQTEPSPSQTYVTSDLQAALAEHGITEKLVPTYLPEGYEQAESFIESADNSTVFISVYRSTEDKIVVKIRQHISLSNRADYEKDGANPEIYEVNGIPHYIMTNMDEYYAAWTNGSYEVNILGPKTKSELTKMIDSIYKG